MKNSVILNKSNFLKRCLQFYQSCRYLQNLLSSLENEKLLGSFFNQIIIIIIKIIMFVHSLLRQNELHRIRTVLEKEVENN